MSGPADAQDGASNKKKYLCLTICGFRRAGMSEEEYRNYMVNIAAPMTKDLMVKYGIKRWTQIHNDSSTRELMSQISDIQMQNLAPYDSFSQVVFESIEDYKRMKADPYYKQNLFEDHKRFADTERSSMTIGWIEEFVKDGKPVNILEFPDIVDQ